MMQVMIINNMNNQLQIWRNKIDKIDNKIILLLYKRTQVVYQIGKWKKKHKIMIIDNKRWKQVLKSKTNLAKNYKLNKNAIIKIFNTIHDMSIEIEKNYEIF